VPEGSLLKPRLSDSGQPYPKSQDKRALGPESDSLPTVEMGLIGSAIRKQNLMLCHDIYCDCDSDSDMRLLHAVMWPQEAIHQCHAWSCTWNIGSDVPAARVPDCRK
jgi:hypothetical protein